MYLFYLMKERVRWKMEREAGSEREKVLHSAASLSNYLQSQDWAKLKPVARNSVNLFYGFRNPRISTVFH